MKDEYVVILVCFEDTYLVDRPQLFCQLIRSVKESTLEQSGRLHVQTRLWSFTVDFWGRILDLRGIRLWLMDVRPGALTVMLYIIEKFWPSAWLVPASDIRASRRH